MARKYQHEELAALVGAAAAAPPGSIAGLPRAVAGVAGRAPSRRTWERRLGALPAALPARIACLGRHLVALWEPWAECGRAVAIDSTPLRARGGVWPRTDRAAGVVPYTAIDTEVHWTKSG